MLFFYNQQIQTDRWIMPWIRIASEYTKIYEAWSLSTDNAHGRKHCFNAKYWDHIPSTRIGMNKIMSVYTARKKTISLPEKAKTKIIWNLCSKRNIYKAAKNIGTAKCFVLYSTWEDMGFVVKPDTQYRLKHQNKHTLSVSHNHRFTSCLSIINILLVSLIKSYHNLITVCERRLEL